MNIFFLLLPKNEMDFIYDDFTLRQAIEKMRAHNYTMIPVVERKTGKYLRSIADGDILRVLIERRLDFDDLETLPVALATRERKIEAVSIYATEEELLEKALNQNYVPVVDDTGSFIGIVTRKKIMLAYIKETAK